MRVRGWGRGRAPGRSGPVSEGVPLGRIDLLFILGFWTGMAALTVLAQAVDPMTKALVPRAFPAAPILVSFVQAYLWAAMTVLIFWATNRYGLDRSNWKARLPLHLAVGLLIALFTNSVVDEIRYRMVQHAPAVAYLPPELRQQPVGGLLPGAAYSLKHLWFLDDLVVCLAMFAAGFARAYSLRYRRRRDESVRLQAEAAELKAQLAEARLGSLRSQLDPHFLFNTLNAVSSLVERDPRGVRRMISRLSELLRRSLDSGETAEVRLEQELEFVGRYLEIMQVRFQGSLQVDTHVDRSVLDALVPTLVLLPLVENAIKHGIGKLVGPGRIEIAARLDGERVVLAVRDNGPGDGAAPGTEGLGLRNTRERLATLYGSAQSLDYRPADGGGVVVEIVLPYHTEADLRTTAVDPDE